MCNSNEDLVKAQMFFSIISEACTYGKEDNVQYDELKKFFIANYKNYLPAWLKEYTSLKNIREFVKINDCPKYEVRRDYLKKAFEKLFKACENTPFTDEKSSEIICSLDDAGIKEHWVKMLERVENDPSGAITMAKTILEAVLKYLAPKYDEQIGSKEDFTALYSKISKKMNLNPINYVDNNLKEILSGCNKIVKGIGDLRNKISDSHPPIGNANVAEARLAVNASATLCLFLIETYKKSRE
jgi:hypothetical protein